MESVIGLAWNTQVRGFRRFLLRGLDQVGAEFDLMALTHNLLKLFRYAPVQPAAGCALS